MQKIRDNVPYARVIVPFVRTPINIMNYAFERTPLALASKSVREDIAAGGARKDLALGKLITGSTVMAISADLALSGSITGAGPTNTQMRNIKRATGWQPYSIKYNGVYYSYQRLDPIGALLGIAADMSEIIGQTNEAEATEVATAAALSVAQNMASKTYLANLTDFFDAFFSSSTDPEAKNYKLEKYLNRLAGSAIPAGVAAIEREFSPEMSATYGMLDSIKSRIQGFSDSLPPRRNIFGDVVVLEGGLGPDIMSPIYTSSEKLTDTAKVADEIVQQQVPLTMPVRTINDVELTPQQYDRLIVLSSGKDNTMAQGVLLKDALKKRI